jgi:hypothetical protein
MTTDAQVSPGTIVRLSVSDWAKMTRGLFALVFTLLTIGGAVVTYAWRIYDSMNTRVMIAEQKIVAYEFDRSKLESMASTLSALDTRMARIDERVSWLVTSSKEHSK